MKLFVNPAKEEWEALVKRPEINRRDLSAQVKEIVEEVKANGDDALRAFSKKFDGIEVAEICVPPSSFWEAKVQVPPALQTAIRQAAANIHKFHATQIINEQEMETS